MTGKTPENYGFGSNEWLLRAGIAYVPQVLLAHALYEVIKAVVAYEEASILFLSEETNEIPDEPDILDIIAQNVFTGSYEELDYEEDAWPPEESEVMSEDEINSEVARFTEQLKKMTEGGEDEPRN